MNDLRVRVWQKDREILTFLKALLNLVLINKNKVPKITVSFNRAFQ
jgi:hypothetical protein